MPPEIQKLELIWIEHEHHAHPQPHILIEMVDEGCLDDSFPVIWEAKLTPCNDPRCGCLNTYVEWLIPPENLGQEPPTNTFWFGIDDFTPPSNSESKTDSSMARIEQLLDAALTLPTRDRLRRWFLAYKLNLVQTTPIESFDISNLPDSIDGQMVGFVDIFPCCLALNFIWNNETWTVDEQYCVEPRCPCSEMILSFLKLTDADGELVEVIHESPALRYDYLTRAITTLSSGPLGSPSLRRLFERLKLAHPDLDDQVELRHHILRSLYIREKKKLAETHQKSARKNAPNVGRNTPCPCGSGRKFKHCCLDKT